MANNKLLPDNLIQDIKSVGTGSFVSWLSENSFVLPQSENLFEGLEIALSDGTIKTNDILRGISELEENSDKNIFLYETKDFKKLITEQADILRDIRQRYGYKQSNDVTVRIKPGNGQTFVYMYVDNEEFKIKFSETHYIREDDLVNDKIIRIPKIVNIYLIIELKSGFAQLRFDTPGSIHGHRNDLNKPTEAAFQSHYKDLIVNLLPFIRFEAFNLSGVANHIAMSEKERFLMRKQVTTISDGAKQTFSTPRKKADVRFLKEHIGAAATDKDHEWLMEDISGFWIAAYSKDELKKNLFMRIYRRDSEIRVSRGCLKKELDYGINQIREIQKAI